MKKLIYVIFAVIICITVYFSDGTHIRFEEATWVDTDAGTFAQAKVFRIMKGGKSIAVIPLDKVKFIIKECK